jgi:hypothetical protein
MTAKMSKKPEKIKIWLKGEFEGWENAKLAQFTGYEIENEDFYEFVARLLKRTEYGSYVITAIYKTVECGFVVKLFKQVENQYGGYTGSITTFVTVDEIIKAIKRGGE